MKIIHNAYHFPYISIFLFIPQYCRRVSVISSCPFQCFASSQKCPVMDVRNE
jgi:hypothetical protein